MSADVAPQGTHPTSSEPTVTPNASPFRRKPISLMLAETRRGENLDGHGGEAGLKRSISTFSLAMIGVGCTVGTGIFFVLGEAVPAAGPAVIIAFVLAAIVAALTALCYAELASMIPVAGSSYSYSYGTLGEIVSFGVACCLLLEYGVSSAAVAVGWSQYVNLFLKNVFGWELPRALMGSFTDSSIDGGIVNLPAVVLVFLCMLLLIRGAKESATTNAVMVVIKLAVLGVFVAVAFTAFNPANFTNGGFFPTELVPDGNWTGKLGIVSTAAGLIFFSYVGLDAVSTAGEEVENPRRALPRALIAALLIVTTIYVLVAVAGIGAQDWHKFKDQEAGLSQILMDVTGQSFWGTFVAAGAIISIFSVTLVTLYGQTRILYSISRDGLLPSAFQKVDPKTHTPVFNTVLVSVLVAIMAGLVPLSGLWNLVSLGTLVAFTVVSIGVILLRIKEPTAERGFRVPGYPVTPILSIAAALYLITSLGHNTLLGGLVMLTGGMMFYHVYSFQHSTFSPELGDHRSRPRLLVPGAAWSTVAPLLLAAMFWFLPDGGWEWLKMAKPGAISAWVPWGLVIGALCCGVAGVLAASARTGADSRTATPNRGPWNLAYLGVTISLIAMAYFIIMDVTAGG